MSTDLGTLDPRVFPWASRLLAQAASPVLVTSVRRSRVQQQRLYRSYLAGRNAFPVAKPDCACATHLQGISWDMIGLPTELRRLGMLWRSWGGIWGDDQDPIHFQAGAEMLDNRSRMP